MELKLNHFIFFGTSANILEPILMCPYITEPALQWVIQTYTFLLALCRQGTVEGNK